MTVHDRRVEKHAVSLRARGAELLRWILLIDGGVCLTLGLIYLVAGTHLGEVLGLPLWLVLPTGAFFLLYGGALAVLSRGREVARATVVLVIAIDALFVVDRGLVAFGGWFAPTTLGVAWMVVQGVAVAAVGVVKYVGLRRAVG